MHTMIIEPGDRGRLHADIAARFHAMLRDGLVAEVETLRRRWRLPPELPAMRAVGYRQVSEYLDGHSRHEEMLDRGIAATRQLARRQLTWLRAEGDAARFDCHAPGLAEAVLDTLAARLAGSD